MKTIFILAAAAALLAGPASACNFQASASIDADIQTASIPASQPVASSPFIKADKAVSGTQTDGATPSRPHAD